MLYFAYVGRQMVHWPKLYSLLCLWKISDIFIKNLDRSTPRKTLNWKQCPKGRKISTDFYYTFHFCCKLREFYYGSSDILTWSLCPALVHKAWGSFWVSMTPLYLDKWFTRFCLLHPAALHQRTTSLLQGQKKVNCSFNCNCSLETVQITREWTLKCSVSDTQKTKRHCFSQML